MSEASERAFAEAKRMIAEGPRYVLQFREAGEELDEIPVEIIAQDKLTIVELSRTHVSDLSPLAKMTWVKELYIQETQVQEIGPIAGMIGLRNLYMPGLPVHDLTPLVGLTNLRSLNLRQTAAVDLNPLVELENLRDLDLSHTRVSDLTPLAGMSHLMNLNISHSQVADLKPLIDLRHLAEGSAGLNFANTPATQRDPELAKISEIPSSQERLAALREYLNGDGAPFWAEDNGQPFWKGDEEPFWKGREPQDEDLVLSMALRGPILSESLADVAQDNGRFRAVTLDAGSEIPADLRHRELLETLRFAASRFGRVETQNRIGRDVAANFADYAEASQQEPLNPRILNLLAEGIRGALGDPHLAEALDGFDRASLSGFLAEHDALIREYYPRALIGPRHQVTTDLARLDKEFFPKLDSAKAILQRADAILAPSVSSALEMVRRQADGARRKRATSPDPEARSLAEAQMRRDVVLATGFIGRIVGRVKQWLAREAAEAPRSHLEAAIRAYDLTQVASALVQGLTPVFHALWQLIGNLPLPF